MNLNCNRLFLLVAVLFFILRSNYSYCIADDSLLIANIDVQIEATEAINDMYNFKFDQAYRQFRWLQQKYPEHPLPYFLMGLNEWWKIMPNDNVEVYDENFLNYMDLSIEKAKELYETENLRIEGAFFLAAAYGFKARLYSERKSWFRAVGSTNKALKYLDDCRSKNELSPELLFGDGIYNYFSNWIPDNYPQLKPFLIFFSKGDKQLGLDQLREVAHNAFYTRIEAQYWLMRILFTEENDSQGALHESEYLHKTFPDNSYFHRYYARILYSTGRTAKAKIISEELLAKVDSGMTGYGDNCGRWASFFLGQIWTSNMEDDKALFYYKRSIEFAESSNMMESGYSLYALMGLAKIYERMGDHSEAKKYLKLVKKNSKRKNPANKKAREHLKSLKEDDDD